MKLKNVINNQNRNRKYRYNYTELKGPIDVYTRILVRCCTCVVAIVRNARNSRFYYGKNKYDFTLYLTTHCNY